MRLYPGKRNYLALESSQTTDYPEWEEGQAAALAQPTTPPPDPHRRTAAPLTLQSVSIRSVLTLAMPAIGEQVLNAIIGLTDTVIAGHIRGTANTIAAATAAVGLMTYLQWFAGLMTAALGVGATAIVARSTGANRTRVANRVAGTCVSAAFLVGVVTAIAMFVLAHQVIALCGLTGQAAAFAQQYLRIMLITISLQTASQIGMAAIRGAGDTVNPMRIMFMVMVINGVASTAFTYGWLGAPAWGLPGDAFGTLLAFLTGGVCTSVILFTGRRKLHLQMRHLRVVPHVLRRVLKIGMPSWVEGVLLWAGQFLIVVFVINARTDPHGYTLAAHVSVLRIESISFLPGFGFGIAASSLVGQYLGAKKPAEARRAGHIAAWLALITMTILALPMVLCPRFMLDLIVHSPPVIQVGFWPMILAGVAQPGFALAIVFSGALKGAGETVLPMISTITGVLLVRLGVLALLLLVIWPHHSLVKNLTAVWIAVVVDLNYRAVFNYLAYRHSRWQHTRV